MLVLTLPLASVLSALSAKQSQDAESRSKGKPCPSMKSGPTQLLWTSAGAGPGPWTSGSLDSCWKEEEGGKDFGT